MMQYSCHIGSVFRTGSTYWFWQEYIQFHHCAAASRRIIYTFQYSQHSISGNLTPHLQRYPEIIMYNADIRKYMFIDSMASNHVRSFRENMWEQTRYQYAITVNHSDTIV